MKSIILALSLLSFNVHAEIIDELQSISANKSYNLTALADRTANNQPVESIFGVAENTCSKSMRLAQFLSGMKTKSCNASYDEVRAKRSIVFASHLLQQQGIKKTHSEENFDKLSQKSMEVYASDFKFFAE